MANIVQRITGVDGDKIAIHALCGAFNEWGRGKVPASEVIAAFNLDAAQQTQLTTLSTLWTAAPDKTRFMRVFKDLMYLGETNTHSRYQDITYVNSRLQDEVSDQGGVLP